MELLGGGGGLRPKELNREQEGGGKKKGALSVVHACVSAHCGLSYCGCRALPSQLADASVCTNGTGNTRPFEIKGAATKKKKKPAVGSKPGSAQEAERGSCWKVWTERLLFRKYYTSFGLDPVPHHVTPFSTNT